MNKTWIAAGFACVLLAPACDRTHLSPQFGVANRQAFKTQVTDPRAGSVVKPDQPLDPEEAAIIAKTYLKSLAPPESAADQTPTGGLLVVPPGAAGAAPPTPTVPR